MKLYREFRTQEEIDEQYDIESAMDMRPYIAWHNESSEQACKSLDCHLDVRFGPTLDEVVDVFPSNRPNSPVLVFIHGGFGVFLKETAPRRKQLSQAADAPV